MLVRELIDILWPGSIPFIRVLTILLILVTTGMVLYYLKINKDPVQNAVGIIVHITCVLPMCWISCPYQKASSRLQLVCVLLLYALLTYGAVVAIAYLSPPEMKSIIKRILIAYGVFYIAAIVCKIGALLLSHPVIHKLRRKLKKH